jgi:hypothetical protein
MITYNSILVIIDRLTKYAYIVLYKEIYTAEDLVYTFLRIILANYKLLNKIISNRDKLFIFRF